jgi:hypothetical protein
MGYIYLYQYLSPPLSIYPFIYQVSLYLSFINQSTYHIPVIIIICQSTYHPSMYLCINTYLSMHLSVYLSTIYQSTYHLSIYLSNLIYLSTYYLPMERMRLLATLFC